MSGAAVCWKLCFDGVCRWWPNVIILSAPITNKDCPFRLIWIETIRCVGPCYITSFCYISQLPPFYGYALSIGTCCNLCVRLASNPGTTTYGIDRFHEKAGWSINISLKCLSVCNDLNHKAIRSFGSTFHAECVTFSWNFSPVGVIWPQVTASKYWQGRSQKIVDFYLKSSTS